MKNVKKENLPTKVCAACKKPFLWRKKWEKVWNEVKYMTSQNLIQITVMKTLKKWSGLLTTTISVGIISKRSCTTIWPLPPRPINQSILPKWTCSLRILLVRCKK
ncbi:MAG: DUF2256 domain-containing protein [Pedobacter sp.]|nr:MAG: DUF2256 domain-containing protein [Pedobacter sp.]